MMNLSKRSIEILRNFSSINPGLLFEAGDTLRTISPSKTILAKATVDNAIESSFAIYDLSRFLGVVSLFNDIPDFNIQEKKLLISAIGRSVSYTFADPSTILRPPSKDLALPSIDVSFKLTKDNLNEINRAIGVMGFPDLQIVGEDGSIILRATDSKNTTADKYDIEVGQTSSVFTALIKAENFKLIDGDYLVELSSANLAKFTTNDIEYWIAIDANGSSFS